MRVDNIQFHPIRLGLRRLARGSFQLERDGVGLGTVKFVDGKWWASKPQQGARFFCGGTSFRSFRAAAVHLARCWTYSSSDDLQDYGSVRMLRVRAGTNWYTVIFDNKRGTYVYEDFSIPEPLSDEQQRQLRKVMTVIEKWAEENL